MIFSAKKLLTQTAKQTVYLSLNPQPQVVTDNVIRGDKHQHDMASKMIIFGEEMGGCLNLNGDLIYFTNDIVVDGSTIMEVKNVEGEYPQWYFNSSVLQCAFYKALCIACGRNLSTAKFFVDLGHQKQNISLNENFNYVLSFGTEQYIVDITDYHPFIGFLQNKINAIKGGYKTAAEFDAKYKWHEYDSLSTYIQCQKISD
jgi:hypothetical protein